MATKGADFLEGLNTILQSQQERERFRRARRAID